MSSINLEDERLSQPPYAALFDEGRELSGRSRRAIVEEADAAVDPLLAILEDRGLWDEEAPGEGWAPIHAARILGDIGNPRAIGPMYRALFECEPDAILDTELTRSLQSFGEDAVSPGLEALEQFGEEFRDDLACVFAGLQVEKRVIFQVLLKNLVQNPILGARNLAQYGDPEALDALHPMLNRLLRVIPEAPSRVDEAKAVAEAIEELGGDLEENQREQLEVFTERKDSAREILERVKKGVGDHHHPDTYVNKHDIGRNDPCWCGSGAKYKHCHWEEDNRE